MTAASETFSADLDDNAKLVSWLLRAPAEVAARCREDVDLRPLAVVSLAAIAIGGAAFGGVIGSFRGGTQIAYAAVKVPMAMLLALAVCVPAFHSLAAVLGRPWPVRTVVSLTLAASARASLLLLAFAPLLWLAYDFGLGYHSAALAAAAAYTTAGMAAFSILLHGFGSGAGRVMTLLAFAAVFFAVAGQTSWVLRPYLVRPKTTAVPFVRATEGSFIDAIWTSMYSSMDIYERTDVDIEGDYDIHEDVRPALPAPTDVEPNRGWER